MEIKPVMELFYVPAEKQLPGPKTFFGAILFRSENEV
jgi:hypothetical protein